MRSMQVLPWINQILQPFSALLVIRVIYLNGSLAVTSTCINMRLMRKDIRDQLTIDEDLYRRAFIIVSAFAFPIQNMRLAANVA